MRLQADEQCVLLQLMADGVLFFNAPRGGHIGVDSRERLESEPEMIAGRQSELVVCMSDRLRQ
eukprot:2129782-Rhodomonas_salina.3